MIENPQYLKGATSLQGTSDEGTDEGSPENTIDKSMAPLNVEVEGGDGVVRKSLFCFYTEFF